jgi:membrane protein YdbS with pleckstrin-like domain
LFAFFQTTRSDSAYGLLLVITDQQWLLFPLVIWALANDIFSIAEAKRLFPILGIAAFSGGIVGNVVAANISRFVTESYQLLVFNAVLILLGAVVLIIAVPRLQLANRPAREGEKLLDSLREGIGFVREVPIFRYLTLSMILLGIGLNAVEFDFLYNVSTGITDPAAVQAFYGGFKVAVAVVLFILQGLVAGWLLNKLGFKHIFTSLPTAMFTGLSMALFFPSLLGVVAGNFVVRVIKMGIDEPSIKAFQGLVPDERRGRVSAFLDGYLFPFGSILSCIMIGALMIAVGNNVLAHSAARAIYLLVAMAAAGIALYSASRIASSYDSSMLNWRLKRRKRDTAGSLDASSEGSPTQPRRTTKLLDMLIDETPRPNLREAMQAAASTIDVPPPAPARESSSDSVDTLLASVPVKRKRIDPLGSLLENDDKTPKP